MIEVVGADGYPRGWVAVILHDGVVADVRLSDTVERLCRDFPNAAAIGVDIPIGLPTSGSRAADLSARRFVGARRQSVFPTPPLAALEASSYAEARALHPSLTQQSYALRRKVLEVDAVAARDPRVFEVHPEASFCALAGGPLAFSKATWNGFHQRRTLLADAGIHVADQMPAGLAGPDDVLDAAAVAWSARRIAGGEARRLPEEVVERDARGRPMAIWY